MTAGAGATTAPGPGRRPTRILAWTIGGAIAIAIVAATMALRASVQPPAGPPVLSGVGGDFELASAAGRRVRLADYRGQVVVVFFGYTHCPDVCPTTLLSVRQAVNELGAAARQVRVIMVSIDPLRDTPDALSAYVRFFDASFVGLSGTVEEIEQVARQYHVFHRQGDASGGAYTVAHSAFLYALDRQGRTRLLLGAEAKPAEIGAAVRQLLGESPGAAS